MKRCLLPRDHRPALSSPGKVAIAATTCSISVSLLVPSSSGSVLGLVQALRVFRVFLHKSLLLVAIRIIVDDNVSSCCQ